MRAVYCLVIGIGISVFMGNPRGFSQEEIPKEFRDIRLGVKLDDMLSTRTNAKPFGFFLPASPATNEVNFMYAEHLEAHRFFDHIMYSFKTNVLDTIIFVGRITGAEANKGKHFLNGLLSTWDVPDQFEVVELDEGKGSFKASAIIWRKEGVFIAASFTSDKRVKATGRGSLQLTIQREQDNGDQLDKVFIVPSISRKEKDDILAPVYNAIEEWRTIHPAVEKRDQRKQK